MAGSSTPLLVSAVNGGGVYLVHAEGVECLSRIDTTGIAALPGGWLFARQAEGTAELRRFRGRNADRICITGQSLDLHDVLVVGDLLYVVCTQINTVLELDAETFVERRSWHFEGEVDSQHINSVCVHDGRILASRFGQSTLHRGYKGQTRGAGEVFDLETGEVVVAGLSQPHSLTSVDGLLWVCDSEARTLRAFRDFVAVGEYALPGYVRGLAFDATRVYAGLSRSRNEDGAGPESAAIVVLDRQGMAEVERIQLTVPEVYDIRLAGALDLDTLRVAALSDATAEFDTQRHAVNIAGIQASHATYEAARLGHVVAALKDREAALEGHIAGLSTRIGALDAALAEASMAERDTVHGMALAEAEEAQWALHLAADNMNLRAGMQAQALHIARQEEALLAAHAYLGVLRNSRSWRWTRHLRGHVDQPPAMLPVPATVEGSYGPAPARLAIPVLGLAFAEHEAPVVSILVTAYGRFDDTLACLRSIAHAGSAVAFEVILVEDASDDAEMARFASVPGLRYHANATNLGFLRSVNAARQLARGQYVLLLNNDTIVTGGWIDALLRTFSIFNECGMAGARLVYPDGRLQEAGGIVWSDGNAMNCGRDGIADDPAYATVREVDYVSGAALVLPAALWDQLDGFDERYLPAYYEDTDLAFRVRQAGYKVYVQPAAVVVHREGVSHGTDLCSGIKASQVANRGVFQARWHDVLQRENLRPGEHVFLARDRGQLKKSVLIVDRHAPHTDRDAGSRAIWQLMRVLHVHGFSVKFWSDEPEPQAVYGDLLRMHGFELLQPAAAEGFEGWIAAHGRYVDYVVLSRPLLASAHIDAVRRHSAAKIVYYGHDVHHLRIERQFLVTHENGLDAHARHLQDTEEGLWERADLVLYPSDDEALHVAQWLERQGLDAARAASVPLFAYEAVAALDDAAGEGPGARDELLFVGGFAHAPNGDGALWFCREVWPLIHRAHPGYRLVLVGSQPDAALLALADDHLTVAGQVSEEVLLAHYARARVAVAPLRFGAGTKGKVLEAMRHGVPCVTTTTGAQGLAAADFLRVADDAPGFAEAVAGLIADDAAWWQASRASQDFVRARFSVHAVWQVLSTLLDPTPYPDVDARRMHMASAITATGPSGGPATGSDR